MKAFFKLSFTLKIGYIKADKKQYSPFDDLVGEFSGAILGYKKAPAWIGVPENLPLYGSKAFDNIQLTM